MNTTANLLLLTGFILLRALAPAYAAPVEIIAHRGASHDAPENTLAAIALAWEQGTDAVEIDVMLSRDGQIVLFHDKQLNRLAGVPGAVADKSFEELRRLDVGRWKGPQWTGQRIPLLSEALATIPEGKRMFVELKTGPEIVPELKRVVARSGKRPEQIVFISFNLDACARAKRELPRHQVAHISRYRRKGETARPDPPIEKLIRDARNAGLDALDLDGNDALGKEEVQRIKAAGLGCYVWTIDDPERARQLVRFGVDGITTNRPQWLRERLSR